MLKNRCFRFLPLIVLLNLFSFPLFGQVNPQDSLILVDFYQSLKGHLWLNNNWLQGPVKDWVGITLTNDEMSVQAIDLPYNNLEGAVPPSICGLEQLQILAVEYNKIEALPSLNCLYNLELLFCQGNLLGFQDVFDNIEVAQLEYQYSPQFAGKDDYEYVCKGENFIIPSELNQAPNQISWFVGDAAPVNPNFPVLPDGSLEIVNMSRMDQGSYGYFANYFSIDLQIIRNPYEIITCARDSLNGPIHCNQLIVKFAPGLTQPQKDSVRNDYNATKLNNVLCSDIELWNIPDTLILLNAPLPPDTLIGVEQIAESTRPRPELEEAEPNSFSERLRSSFGDSLSPTMPIAAPPFLSNDSLVIAIIDTGLDEFHPVLSSYVKLNDAEIPDGVDNDGNCLVDDIAGLNLIDSTSAPSDDHSHGSHVAGIITGSLQAVSNSKILTIKSHDHIGRSSLFNLIVGIYYACSKDARVINISSGYYGAASSILRQAIQEAGEECNAIVVTSAGNNGSDTDLDSLAHYPSGYQLPNLISVAALTATQDGLAPYSNYGATSIDLAAPGTGIISTVPNGGMDDKSGSSMSAAWLSGVTVNLMEEFPEVQHQEIRGCILSTTTPTPELMGKTVTGGKLDYDAARTCVSTLPPGFRLQYFLEGPYDATTGRMKDDILQNGLLPTAVPASIYGVIPDNAATPIDPILLAKTGDSAVVDWIIVQLRDKNDKSIVLENLALLVRTNGQVITTSGNDAITFPNRSTDDYHLTVIHRNHLPLNTKSQVTLFSSHRKLNITSLFNSNGQNSAVINLGNGHFGAAAGDASQDGIIDSADRSATWNFRNLSGYLKADVTGDGQIDSEDRSKTWNNRNKTAN